MKTYDMVELATRNLREAILRNSLTTMGISVGVASLVAMMSLGAGLQKVANKNLGRSGLFDSIIVSSRADFRNQEDRQQNKVVQSSELKSLDDKARAEFAKLPNVIDVYPDIRLMAEMRFKRDPNAEPKSHFSMLAALPASAKASEVFDDVQGTFFSSPTASEAIILAEFARELLDAKENAAKPGQPDKLTPDQLNQILGKEITLRYAERKPNMSPGDVAAATGSPEFESTAEDLGFSVERREKVFKIVGVVPSEPYGGFRGGTRGSIYIPTTLAEALNMLQPTDLRTMMRKSEGKSYFTLVVRVTGSAQVKAVQDTIKGMGYTTFSMLDASKGMARFFLFLDLFLAIFGSLALAVASLGIVNTLVMAILERRREIGIMKALGASDIDVKKLFFVEAGSMGAFGGILGIALGWAIGRAINFGTNIYLQRNDLPPENFWYIPAWLVFAAFGFAVVVSLLSGMYPASRAAKLDPVQALRHD
jgi:putative ABC transport system permease protein